MNLRANLSYSKQVDDAIQNHALLMSHGGAVLESINPDFRTNSKTFLSGFFEYNGEVVHVDSDEGKAAIEILRADRDFSKEWMPATLPPHRALRQLLIQHHAKRLVQHGGIGQDAQHDLHSLVLSEIDYRRSQMEVGCAYSPSRNETESDAPNRNAVFDNHGIAYPNQAYYSSLSQKDKAKLTKTINTMRKEHGLDKVKWAQVWEGQLKPEEDQANLEVEDEELSSRSPKRPRLIHTSDDEHFDSL